MSERFILRGVMDLIKDLPPEVWVPDNVLDVATYDAPITGRHAGEPWIVISFSQDGQCLRVDLKAPILKGETRGRRWTYLLENDRRDPAVNLTPMRWPD